MTTKGCGKMCECSKHMVGKVVIVTGGNAGIGYETAKDLADRGARVILACRNRDRGIAARDKIIALTGNTDVYYRSLDFASLTSVRAFVREIIATENKLDVLINNAGIFEGDNVKTEDGLQKVMQINHFGPFLLTSLLLPLLKSSAPSRIINVSSESHKHGSIDFKNFDMDKELEKSFYFYKIYSDSKLCNVLMTIELDRKLKGTGVTVNSLHPGVVSTDILSADSKSILVRMQKIILKPFMINAWKGAQTTIYLAVSPEVNDVSGRYFIDCKEAETSKKARDTETARKLWEVSETLVKIR